MQLRRSSSGWQCCPVVCTVPCAHSIFLLTHGELYPQREHQGFHTKKSTDANCRNLSPTMLGLIKGTLEKSLFGNISLSPVTLCWNSSVFMATLSLESHLVISNQCHVGREGYFYFVCFLHFKWPRVPNTISATSGRKEKCVTSVGSIGKEHYKMPCHWSLALSSPKGKCHLWVTAVHPDIIWLRGSSGTRIWNRHSLVVCWLLFHLCSQHWSVSWEWLTEFHGFEKLQAADIWMSNLPTKYVSFIFLCNF